MLKGDTSKCQSSKIPKVFCFLGKINYNDFIRRHLGERKGPVIEIETGKKIGEHHGYWFHTIGQRKGLGLSGGPWYVVKKNVKDNAIYVSKGYDTEKTIWQASTFNRDALDNRITVC